MSGGYDWEKFNESLEDLSELIEALDELDQDSYLSEADNVVEIIPLALNDDGLLSDELCQRWLDFLEQRRIEGSEGAPVELIEATKKELRGQS